MRFAVLVGILLIALPLLVRTSMPEQFPDSESYEGLRQAQLTSYDSLYAKPHHASPADVLFRFVPAQLLLIILAAVTLFALTYYYDSESFILFFATSPAFIVVFTLVGEGAIGIALIAIAAALIAHKKYWAVLLVPACFLFGFSIGVLATITVISVALIRNTPFVALGAAFFALVSAAVSATVTPTFYSGISVPSVPQFLGLFGMRSGITIFLLALGAIGFLVQYSKDRKPEQLISLAIIPCALFFEYGSIIIAAFLAVYASRAWDFLSTRKWDFDEIRTFTLILITCVVLFTTIVVERERMTLDEGRVDVTQFITTAYPRGTGVAADSSLWPILAYKGYPSGEPQLPPDPGFVGSAMREQGYSYIATTDETPPYEHFAVVYSSDTYDVYEVPQR